MPERAVPSQSERESDPIGWVSSCCRSARMTTRGGDGSHGSTCWTICRECGEPCDAVPVFEPAAAELPTTWPNGVPYIDDETRAENVNDPLKLRELICHMNLHGAYDTFGKVKHMTTEQKELFADVLDSQDRDFETEPYLRWWRNA